MHVVDEVEDWLAARIEAWAEAGSDRPLLVVLSGNAGDGKSDLIERLLDRLAGLADRLSVVRDATHAETPSEDQLAKLAGFFADFSDGAEPDDAKACLIAMNTGMALSFLDRAREDDALPSFSTLGTVLKSELGLLAPQESVDVPPPWDFEVVNLDRRNLLVGNAEGSFLEQMLDRLDPENPDGVLFDSGERCAGCAAREWCFVRTNVDLLQDQPVRNALYFILWEASLGGQVHLSPRNLWDLLYQITTGGIEFFEGYDSYCGRIESMAPEPGAVPSPETIAEAHSRALYHLLFEPPAAAAAGDRGPLLGAVSRTDPVRRSGRFSHQAESAVHGDLASDADRMDACAAALGRARTGEETADEPPAPPDPFLENLARLMRVPELWERDEVARAGRGVLRRALLTGAPPSIADELHDGELDEYLLLLSSYATWRAGGAVPDEVRGFARQLVNGVRQIFGIEVGGRTYFRQDSFSPSTRFPSFVEVGLESAIQPVPDEDLERGQEWLAPLRYSPSYLSVQIQTGAAPWHVRADLALFRLMRRVSEGYAASSVDLETFFGLRFACERLGSAHQDATELIVRDVAGGDTYRLEERQELGSTVLAFEPVGG